MQTLSILLILAGPLACFVGCLVAALGELWVGGMQQETAAERQERRWYANADRWN